MRVLVADALELSELEALVARGIEVLDHRGIEAEALPAALQDCEGLLVRSRTQVDAALLEACPALRIVGRAGSGVDNIDLDAATSAGVLVSNTPGGNTNAAAEHTLALIFALARHLPQAAQSLAEGRWERTRFVGIELKGRRLGLVGLGRIGLNVARGARGLGMEVLATDPLIRAERAAELGIQLVSLPELVERVDFLSVHVPLVEKTRGLIGAELLARARPGIRILNVARGGIVDEGALLAGLESGRVAGAALDVFESEPPEPSALLRHPGVIATPHLGASTVEAQRGVAQRIAEQVASYLETGFATGAVNASGVDAGLAEFAAPWLKLARRLGRLAQGIHRGAIHWVDVRIFGEAAQIPQSVVLDEALLGVLGQLVSRRVTAVNARSIAKERSLELRSRVQQSHPSFHGLLQVSVGSGDEETLVEGSLFGPDHLRLMGALGFSIDAALEGDMLLAENEDRPGMIASFSGVLADAEINVANMSVGRKSGGGLALSATNLDSPAGDAVVAALQAMPGIRWARGIRVSDS